LKNFKLVITFLFTFCLSTPVWAEGQDGLEVILDGVLFVFIFIISIKLTLSLIEQIKRKKVLSKKSKFFIWIIMLSLALFIWSMLKTDARPFEGPIDSIIHRNAFKEFKNTNDDKVAEEMPDSTIEETIASVDTNQIGVYIWLNHKKYFVRKLASKLETRRQLDSLTMSIVRKWPKK
jgi:hypothetical protein